MLETNNQNQTQSYMAQVVDWTEYNFLSSIQGILYHLMTLLGKYSSINSR